MCDYQESVTFGQRHLQTDRKTDGQTMDKEIPIICAMYRFDYVPVYYLNHLIFLDRPLGAQPSPEKF